jgi:hypothetical protein
MNIKGGQLQRDHNQSQYKGLHIQRECTDLEEYHAERQSHCQTMKY